MGPSLSADRVRSDGAVIVSPQSLAASSLTQFETPREHFDTECLPVTLLRQQVDAGEAFNARIPQACFGEDRDGRLGSIQAPCREIAARGVGSWSHLDSHLHITAGERG